MTRYDGPERRERVRDSLHMHPSEKAELDELHGERRARRSPQVILNPPLTEGGNDERREDQHARQ